MVGLRDGCRVGEGMGAKGWMWGGWRGIRGRDKSRGTNRQTSGRSCAHAWAPSSAWPLSSCCRSSSCLLIQGLRVRRSYTANHLHCCQDISNVLVVLRAHLVTAQQTEVSFNLHMEIPSLLVMQYEINNANEADPNNSSNSNWFY